MGIGTTPEFAGCFPSTYICSVHGASVAGIVKVARWEVLPRLPGLWSKANVLQRYFLFVSNSHHLKIQMKNGFSFHI